MEPFDPPEEAAFRTDALAWLEANAKWPSSPEIAPSAIVAEWSPEVELERLTEARDWQRTKYEDGWAGVPGPKSSVVEVDHK